MAYKDHKEVCVILLTGMALLASFAAESSEIKGTLYGRAQIEAASFDDNTSTDGTRLDDNAAGRIGVKFEQKFDDNFTGLAGYEWRNDTTDNEIAADKAPMSARESYIALKTPWGTIGGGNSLSPYKVTGGVKYDPFVTTLLEARGNGGMSAGSFGHNNFIADSLWYKSPHWNNISAWLLYSPDEVSGNSRGADKDFAYGIKYASKQWETFISGVNDESATLTRTKVGGSVKFKEQHRIVAQFESSEISNSDERIYFAGYHFKLQQWTFIGQLGRADPDGSNNNTDYSAMGAQYDFSKAFRFFSGYRNSNPEMGDDTRVISVGLNFRFGKSF